VFGSKKNKFTGGSSIALALFSDEKRSMPLNGGVAFSVLLDITSLCITGESSSKTSTDDKTTMPRRSVFVK
jgi:hypothetical protein